MSLVLVVRRWQHSRHSHKYEHKKTRHFPRSPLFSIPSNQYSTSGITMNYSTPNKTYTTKQSFFCTLRPCYSVQSYLFDPKDIFTSLPLFVPVAPHFVFRIIHVLAHYRRSSSWCAAQDFFCRCLTFSLSLSMPLSLGYCRTSIFACHWRMHSWTHTDMLANFTHICSLESGWVREMIDRSQCQIFSRIVEMLINRKFAGIPMRINCAFI